MKLAMRDWLVAHGKPDAHKLVEYIGHEDRSDLMDVVGWALFCIWVGFAWLLDLGLGWAVLGGGMLLLVLQAVRALVHARVDVFWIFVAMAFVVGGFWELWNVAIPLAPAALIALGFGLVVWYCTKTLSHRKRMF